MTAIAKLTWYDKKIVEDDTNAKILSLFSVNDDQAFTEKEVAERLNLDISEVRPNLDELCMKNALYRTQYGSGTVYGFQSTIKNLEGRGKGLSFGKALLLVIILVILLIIIF